MFARKVFRRRYVQWRRRRIYGRCVSPPSRLLVLRYHSIGESARVSEYLNPALSVDSMRFRDQIRMLRRKFEVISAQAIESALRERRQRPAVLITFDDGYRDNYELASPILADENATGVFFIATGPLQSRIGLWTSELWRLARRLPAGALGLPSGAPAVMPAEVDRRHVVLRELTMWLSALSREQRENALDRLAHHAGVPRGEGLEESFVTPEQLREMKAAGMTIGAHTRSHPHLDRLETVYHRDEVNASKQDLESVLGGTVDMFAYPNPGGEMKVAAAARHSVEAAEFAYAFTSLPGPVLPSTDRFAVPRVGVYRGEQERLLFDLLNAV